MVSRVQYGRRAHAGLAIVTWFSLALGLVLTVFNINPVGALYANSLGDNPSGIAGLPGRVIDSFSYFTNLSLIIVGVVATMLARDPQRSGRLWSAIHMDALVMISITGLIYAVVLAPDAQVEGVDIIVNALKHYIVPALTVIIWLFFGPRRQITFASIFTALVVPITWALYTLIRGEFIAAYPYPFLNVIAYGLPTVLMNIAGVAAFGIVLGLIFWGIDLVLTRITSPVLSSEE